MRKWASNSPLLLTDIDAANHGLACSRSLSTDEKVKILDIAWNPSLDVFQVTVSLSDHVPQTKRSILSAIARLYDPLGWVTPVTIAAKIFLQQLWREKLSWDDTVPHALLERWNQMYSKLALLNGLQITRWTALGNDVLNSELHGFVDASNLAYSALFI